MILALPLVMTGQCVQLDGGDIYAEWMLYINDHALFTEVVMPESHNAGSVNCTFGILRCGWLDCQMDDLHTQLCHGVRCLDIRVLEDKQGIIRMAHGSAQANMTLEQALADIRRFRDAYPSEIITVSIRGYTASSVSNAETASTLIYKYLAPEKHAIPKRFDLSKATMKDVRKSRKNYIISSPWVDEQYTNSDGTVGTWTGNVNFGKVIEGQKLYNYIYDLLEKRNGRFRFSLNRASGNKMRKEKPVDFMLYDRENFITLTDYLEKNPEKLAKVAGFSFDFSTYDYVQPGRTLRLNAVKGLIKPEYRDCFYNRITEKLK